MCAFDVRSDYFSVCTSYSLTTSSSDALNPGSSSSYFCWSYGNCPIRKSLQIFGKLRFRSINKPRDMEVRKLTLWQGIRNLLLAWIIFIYIMSSIFWVLCNCLYSSSPCFYCRPCPGLRNYKSLSLILKISQ